MLTKREAEVVRMLREGDPYKTIAYELGIAESTARVHGSRGLHKLKRSRLQVLIAGAV